MDRVEKKLPKMMYEPAIFKYSSTDAVQEVLREFWRIHTTLPKISLYGAFMKDVFCQSVVKLANLSQNC